MGPHTYPHLQVRGAAYASLSAYPLALLERIEASVPLATYVAPLAPKPATEALLGPTAAGALEAGSAGATGGAAGAAAAAGAAPFAWEADPAAREAAEKLAVLAVQYEYENRRRFLAAPGAGAGGLGGAGPGLAAGAGAGGGASAEGPQAGGSDAAAKAAKRAAVMAREASAVRHRLTSVLPPLLSAVAAGGAGAPPPATAPTGTGHPGAILLCYKPKQGPKAGSSALAKTGAAAGAQGQDGWAARMGAALAGLPAVLQAGSAAGGVGALGAGGCGAPSLLVRTWGAFFARWVQGCAGVPSAVLMRMLSLQCTDMSARLELSTSHAQQEKRGPTRSPTNISHRKHHQIPNNPPTKIAPQVGRPRERQPRGGLGRAGPRVGGRGHCRAAGCPPSCSGPAGCV